MPESEVIESKRLRIITFSEEYLTPRYVSWLNDPDVVLYLRQRHERHSLQSCREYWQSFVGTVNYFWAIVARDPQLGHIGNINAYVDTPNLVADVGILIGEKRALGHGYGSEAWIAVCNYLFRVAGMRKVTAGTLSVNAPMLGVMRHSGMLEDGRRVRQCLFQGEEVDVVHAALFRDDWGKRILEEDI